jgi:nitroreductase/NAD-dependent dihydropyrimidine dehydrogenase PreA subunit
MFFQVDNQKCNKDQICVVECPARILEMTEQGPVMRDGGEDACIRCGHCVAVCPVAAVQLDFLSPEECLPVSSKVLPDTQQAELFLRSRRSIRTYRKKPLPKEILEKALDIASAAPTGSNRQPVKWLVFYEQKDVETIAAHVTDWMRYMLANHPDVAANFNMEKLVADVDKGIDRICRNAPHLVFAYASKEFGIAAADCHTALAYLELALPAFGAGSCWAGYIYFAASQWPPLAAFLAVPEEYQLHGGVMAGYPKFVYHRIPSRNAPDITYRQ